MTAKRHRKRIVRELPPAGTTLQGRFRGENFAATIVEAEGLPAGRGVKFGEDIYPSLSAAAGAITKQSVNGLALLAACRARPPVSPPHHGPSQPPTARLTGGWLLSGSRATRTPPTVARPGSVPPILSHIRPIFA